MSPLALLTSWLTRSANPLFRFSFWGIAATLRLAGIRTRVLGRAHLKDAHNTLVLANHVSHVDPPLLFWALGVDFKAVAKKEVFFIPFFGSVLKRAGFVSIDRRNTMQAHGAVSATSSSLAAGSCFLMFPEGTRSPTGELLPFKKGGFVAALAAGSRIVPVVVSGTRECLPKGSFWVRSGDVVVRILDPVDARSYSYANRDELIREVRNRMAAALLELGPSSGPS